MPSKPKVYIISGPIAVGKSTVAKILHQKIGNSILIEGDEIMNALRRNENMDWVQRLDFSWQAILSLSNTALRQGYNVIIDYVVETEINMIKKELKSYEISYNVLFANSKELNKRLLKRGDIDLQKRQKELVVSLQKNSVDNEVFIDTSDMSPQQAVEMIINKNLIRKLVN